MFRPAPFMSPERDRDAAAWFWLRQLTTRFQQTCHESHLSSAVATSPMNPARRLIREPDVASPHQYRRRVRQLAVTYVLSLLLALTGICLLIANGRLLVDLTQKSNVETLIILFFIVFFGYIVVLSLRGA